MVNMSLKFDEDALCGLVSSMFTIKFKVWSTHAERQVDAHTDRTTEMLLYLLYKAFRKDNFKYMIQQTYICCYINTVEVCMAINNFTWHLS